VSTSTGDLLMRTPLPPEALWRKGWDRCAFDPYGLQEEILLNGARNKVLAAGRRAGKSRLGGHRLVPEAFRAWYELDQLRKLSLRREYWIVGPEYSDAEKEFRVIWDSLLRLGFKMDHPGSYNNPDSGVMSISLFDRAFRILAQSAKYPANLVGEGLSGVVFSEAAKLKPSVWHKFIRPTLADFGGWAQFGSTPEGKNWFYDIFMTGLDPNRPEWAAWRAPSWVNPYVYPEGVDEKILKMAISERANGKNIRDAVPWHECDRGFHPVTIDAEIWALWQDMSQELFNQEVAALFTEFVGRVFKDFDEELHVTDQDFIVDWETYAVVDYGFTNPNVWLIIQVDPHRNMVHVLDEYYAVNRTTTEMADDILSRGLAPRTIRAFYPDPASPGDTRTLSAKLRIPAANPGSLMIQDRLEWIRRKLKPGTGWAGGPAFTINRRCVNTIREFNDYRYPETAEKAAEKGRHAPENPAKKDDHTPEAIGRLFSGLFGSPHVTRARQSRARTSR
jgi:hypothetical protein